jgi:hypothetical protein
VGNTGLILSGQYMLPQFLASYILENILMYLSNFLRHHNSKNIGFSHGNTTFWWKFWNGPQHLLLLLTISWWKLGNYPIGHIIHKAKLEFAGFAMLG